MSSAPPSPKFAHAYVHLPFCDVICHYCDFYTARSQGARHEDFFSALAKETLLQLPLLEGKLKALYFGGGTPSVSPPELLHQFIELFGDRIGPETEVTLEANPNNVEPGRIRAWKAAGINRLSLGIQSLDDTVLKRLGRTHSADLAKKALALCLEEIPNVSGDLIYAVPGQSERQPAEHAREMAEIGLKHISAYNLTLEPGHFLHARLPDDAFAWNQIQKVAEILETKGFRHYEISNFGQPGFESRNNKNYWKGGSYLALGPSAHGFDGESLRWRNVANWEKYIERIRNGESAIEEREELSPEQRRIEALFTGLRTSEGLNIEAFARKFGQDLLQHPEIKEFEKRGLATVTNGHFVLTFSGRMLSDEIAQKLV